MNMVNWEEKDMQTKNFRKVLVIGIILLFISVSFLSFVSSKEVSFYYNNITKNNVNNELFDDNEEIITRITGWIYIEDYKDDWAPIRKVELWDSGYVNTYLKISGYKKPIFPLNNSQFNANPKHIIAYRFIGWIFQYDRCYCLVDGIAIGNIDWE